MKLKKIASLALAGVMAVSMLAGCAGKTGTTDDGTTVVTTGSSAAASTFNAGQDADNKVKVTFSTDSKLDALVSQAVKSLGDNAAAKGILENIEKTVGGTNEKLADKKADNKTLSDGMTKTQWTAKDYTTENGYWTEEDAVKAAARDMDAVVAKLAENTREGKNQGDTYYEFSYTGSVAVVSVVKADGTTAYHVVYTITQTAAKKTV